MSQDPQAHDIEVATVQLSPVTQGPPDAKTRRYDRQLRLWAASGQNALEAARVLVLSGSATSTSILKNLVLPGIGHFTILDASKVTPEDAGNNFFLEGQASVGKSRAKEAVRLLLELNDSVEGVADESDLDEILTKRPEYFATFSIVIAHNIDPQQLAQLSSILWQNASLPPLVVVRSAGFLAEFYIQFHEHTVVDSHSDTPPSLRIDKAFPALIEHANSLDFANMDPVDHSHVPYVVILVRALEDWKAAHSGNIPKTFEEKKQFKHQILDMRRKPDEENFEEAEAQAYRIWSSQGVPSDVQALFADPGLIGLSKDSPPFFHLLNALKKFVERPPHVLPLSAALPDMKSDTRQYVHLQTLYKRRAEEERAELKRLLDVEVHDSLVAEFVKNAHGIRILRGKRWGALDEDQADLQNAFAAAYPPREPATHLALSALSAHFAKAGAAAPTLEQLQAEARAIIGPGFEAPDELDNALGELVRAPTADLPTTAAFLGGVVAQEVIKVITTQYVPINGYCVIDLIESWTGLIANPK
ncbi:hypothetical protein AURDEDRAFT_112722 [Auricularia subglabra TFB-10046 SS5]|nr:hypothetical protein AURDEDRAFT_112722 [Auricularia subglabra TFB-10046 SS5]